MVAKPTCVLAGLAGCCTAITLPIETPGRNTPASFVSGGVAPEYSEPELDQTQDPYVTAWPRPQHADPDMIQPLKMATDKPVQMPRAPLHVETSDSATKTSPWHAEPYTVQPLKMTTEQQPQMPQASSQEENVQRVQIRSEPEIHFSEQKLRQLTQLKVDEQIWVYPAELPVSALSLESRQLMDQWTANLNELAYMRANAMQEATAVRQSHEIHAQQPQPLPQSKQTRQPQHVQHSPPEFQAPQPQQSETLPRLPAGRHQKFDKWMAELGSKAQLRADEMMQSIKGPTYQIRVQGLAQHAIADEMMQSIKAPTYQIPVEGPAQHPLADEMLQWIQPPTYQIPVQGPAQHPIADEVLQWIQPPTYHMPVHGVSQLPPAVPWPESAPAMMSAPLVLPMY